MADYGSIMEEEANKWATECFALRAENARLREHLELMIRIVEDAAPGAFRNGNTAEFGHIDEGEVLTGRCVERARAALEGKPE